MSKPSIEDFKNIKYTYYSLKGGSIGKNPYCGLGADYKPSDGIVKYNINNSFCPYCLNGIVIFL